MPALLWTLLTSRASHILIAGAVSFFYGYHKAAVVYGAREMLRSQQVAAEAMRRAIILEDVNEWALRDAREFSEQNARLEAQVKDIENASTINNSRPCLDVNSVRRLNRVGK